MNLKKKYLILIVEWIAVFTTLSGAILTTLSYDPWNVYVLNTGAFLWVTWSILSRKLSIGIVNLGMLIIYSAGTIHRLAIMF